MKEMLGGCCVCSDENGWNGNPLVYCDGPDCEVAVHQGCYGILEVPEGEWLCAKCQVASAANGGSKTNGVSDHRNGTTTQPSTSHPRCDLCPFGYGALKRTNNNSWAHVICALYIPEVKFGDVHSMDPVILDDVPQDRFDRICYLCEDEGAPRSAKVGACMNCNRPGCKKSFHVTCAQRRGLLCEEGGASKNVKYCGYCAHHLKKAKAQDPSIKVVPPCKVRPLPTLTSSSSIDRSIEKTIDNHSKKHKSKYSSSSYGSSSLSNSVRDSNHHQSNGGGATSASSSLASTPKRAADENGEKMMIDQLRSEPSLGSTVLAAGSSGSPSDLLAAATGSTTFSPPLTSSSRSSLAQENATPPLKDLHLNGHSGHVTSLPGPSTSSAGTSTAPFATGSPSSSTIPMGGSATTIGGGRGASPTPSSTLFNGASHQHLTNHNRLADAASPMSTSSGGGFAPSTSKGALNGHGGNASPSPHLQSTSQLIAAAAAAANSATMVSALNTSVGSTTTHNHPNVHPSVSGSVPVGAAIAAGLVTPKAGLGAFPVSSHAASKRAAKDHDSKGGKRARTNPKSTVRELLDAVEPLVSDTVADFQRERVDKAAAAAAAAAARGLQQPLMSDSSPYAMGAQRANSLLAAAAQAQQLVQHGRNEADVKASLMDPMGLNGMSGGLGLPSTSSSSQMLHGGGVPQGLPATMEELLERQWEQGSSFFITNSHFDVAQLLSIVHQLKKENTQMEDTLSTMTKRRDHLLALNARLAMPLGVTAAGAAAPSAPAMHSPAAMQQQLGGLAALQQHAAAAAPPPATSQPEDSLRQLQSLATGGRASAVASRSTNARNGQQQQHQQQQQQQQQSSFGAFSGRNNPATSSSQSLFPSSSPLASCTQSPSFPPPPQPISTQAPTTIPSNLNSELERLATVLAQSSFLNNPAARQQLMGGGNMDQLISTLLMQQQQQQQAASLINPNTAALMRMIMGNSGGAGASPASTPAK